MRSHRCLSFIFFVIVNISANNIKDMLTIITPIPVIDNLSIDIILFSQKSLFIIPELAECKKIIIFDSTNKMNFENVHSIATREQYTEFKDNFIEFIKTTSSPYFKNTTFIFLNEYKGHAWSLEEAMKLVTTKYVCVHQYNRKLIKKFDLINLIRTMEYNPDVRHINISSYINNSDNIEQVPYGLSKLFRYFDTDHITSVKYYTEMIFPRIHGHDSVSYWMMAPDLEKQQKNMECNHQLYGTYMLK